MYYIFSKLIKYRKIYLVSMAKVPHLSETDTPRQIFFNFKSTPTTYTKFQHSVQFSRSVVSDSLQLHKLQHARPPCPSPTPRVHSDLRPSILLLLPCPSGRVCAFITEMYFVIISYLYYS